MTTYEEAVESINKETPIDYTSEFDRANAYNKSLVPYISFGFFSIYSRILFTSSLRLLNIVSPQTVNYMFN